MPQLAGRKITRGGGRKGGNEEGGEGGSVHLNEKDKGGVKCGKRKTKGRGAQTMGRGREEGEGGGGLEMD